MSIEIANAIENHKSIVICRGLYGESLLELIAALYEGGIRLVEVTFDQNDPGGVEKTSEAIKLIKNNFPEIYVGSGTATKIEHVQATKEAGGEFVLSPNVNIDVITETKNLDMISIPGAMTSSEILDAHDAGADFVKIFPAGWLGLDYLKDIKGPINHVKFIAAGGVKEDNYQEVLDAGYAGAGISSRLVDKECIQAGNFKELTKRAEVFTEIATGNS